VWIPVSFILFPQEKTIPGGPDKDRPDGPVLQNKKRENEWAGFVLRWSLLATINATTRSLTEPNFHRRPQLWQK
jgi:hypothetical protein